ncbi:hypothetical protein GQ53DRAFT_536771 [Thozetella sp. PMI_491]|nr:hypothetical protein GQ53DRAFT_536771 [Thozetella sp. PMI_491]
MQLPLVLDGPDPTLQANSLAASAKGREEDQGASSPVPDPASRIMKPPSWKPPLPSPPIAPRGANAPASDDQPRQPSPRLQGEPRTPLSPPSPSPCQDGASDLGHSTIVVAPLSASVRDQSSGNSRSVNGAFTSSPTIIRDVYDPDNIGDDDDLAPGKRRSDHLGNNGAFVSQPRGKRLKTAQGGGRAVEYEIVYANGQPQHRIVRVPRDQHEGEWYIFICLKHHRHFSRENTYRQVYSHLLTCKSGATHRPRESCWNAFVAHFGIRVLGCDARKEAESNRLLDQAVAREGYAFLDPAVDTFILKHFKSMQVYENLARDGSLHESQGSTGGNVLHTVPNRDGGHGVPATWAQPLPTVATAQPAVRAVRTPQPGDLYRVMGCVIGRERLPCVVLVLPIGDFGQIGIAGRLADTGLLNSPQHVPSCFRLNQSTRSIEGWAPDYQDGGPRVEERFYPVMCFISSASFAKNGPAGGTPMAQVQPYNWAHARDLLPVDLDNENSLALWGFEAARQFRQKRLC